MTNIKTIANEVYAQSMLGLTEDEKRILMIGLSAITHNLALTEAPREKVTK